MMLAGCRKAIFRRNGVTVIYSQTADGWWHISKLKGGRELASRVVKELPARQAEHVQATIRASRQPNVKRVAVRSS